ncbi:hypothetical protein ACWEQG_23075 [Microbispora sp. NPDC004025]
MSGGRHEAARAKSLDVDDLVNGQGLRETLVAALSASHRADSAYLTWARRYKAAHCRGRTVGDPAYDAGNAASVKATAAKRRFLVIWNPIAVREGLPTRQEDEI